MKRALFSLMLIVLAAAPARAADTIVSLKTSLGEIQVAVDATKAPITVDNFLFYVKSGFYDGTIFHRVIENFVIQGGGLDANMVEKPTARGPIKNEANNGLKNAVYTIAMARETEPDTATSQFYINVKDNPGLDYPGRDGWGYCVFGKVIKGADVVDAIKKVPTTTKGEYEDVPVTPVVIQSATVVGI